MRKMDNHCPRWPVPPRADQPSAEQESSTAQNSALRDSRQFLSSLRSPQSLSKSHRQTLLMQFPLLQRCWLRRQALSVGGRVGRKKPRLPSLSDQTCSSEFHFSSSGARLEGKAERGACRDGPGSPLSSSSHTWRRRGQEGRLQAGTMTNKESDDASGPSG